MSRVDISAKAPPELVLLPPQEPLTSRHFVAMALASIALHIVGGTIFMSLPEVIPPPRATIVTSDLHKAVHLYVPKIFEPTQKTPNLSKIVRPELDVRSERETPQPQTPKMRRPQPLPGPVAPPVSAPTPQPVIEPPKIQVAAVQPPPAPPSIAPAPSPNGTTAQAAPPPASFKPRISFENVAPPPPVKLNGPPDPRLLMQAAAMERAAQTATRPPGGGGLTVGDAGDDLTDLPRLDQTRAKGRMGSDLQLLSDPAGVDFQPYLRQILASVKRNWMMVIPTSAGMGRRGTVLVQFIIDRHGGVPKLVIATSSGTEAFDRAAVSGISASTPFPPLPADFTGDQVRLQLSFKYNAPAH